MFSTYLNSRFCYSLSCRRVFGVGVDTAALLFFSSRMSLAIRFVGDDSGETIGIEGTGVLSGLYAGFTEFSVIRFDFSVLYVIRLNTETFL